MSGFDFNRPMIGLMCVGAAQASLDETWRYAHQRETFGRTLGEHQGFTFPPAEFEGLLEASRRLCYRTLGLRDDGWSHTSEAAMWKWLAPKTAFEAIRQCLLSHGHYGWSQNLPHQQRMRDVMGLEIGDGTAQVMKMIIARDSWRRARATAFKTWLTMSPPGSSQLGIGPALSSTTGLRRRARPSGTAP